MTTAGPVTFFTVADARYFVGAVALLNSLRLTGHCGELVVVDCGLQPWQRERLGACASIVAAGAHPRAPVFVKASIPVARAAGVAVYVDADVIVTGSLMGIVEQARAGRICAVPDLQPRRFFSEWQQIFDLEAPPRRQTYVNSGFFAFSPSSWPHLASRWQAAAARIATAAPPQFHLSTKEDANHPLAFHDQDALNAVLMAEVPADALLLIDPALAPMTPDLAEVRCLDARTLRCSSRGRAVHLLHHITGPKPWQRGGWMTMRGNAYVRVLPRLLLGPDLAVRLDPLELPIWLRGQGRRSNAVRSLARLTVPPRAVLRRAVPHRLQVRLKTSLIGL